VIDDRQKAGLEAVLQFRGESPRLGAHIDELERAIRGLTLEEAQVEVERLGVGHQLLAGALLVKGLTAQIDVILHAVGILLSLPYVLEPGERIVSVSLGASSSASPWDLVTDRQIAEFKFIHWKGADSRRKRSLLEDLCHLAEADTDKARYMYLTGTTYPMRFLAGHGMLKKMLDPGLFDSLTRRHGPQIALVSQYWAKIRDQVQLVDLKPLVPGLIGLDAT
jgi:hypothetical protein